MAWIPCRHPLVQLHRTATAAHKKAVSSLLGFLLEELHHFPRICGSRVLGPFGFNRDQPLVQFDNEVDFRTVLCAQRSKNRNLNSYEVVQNQHVEFLQPPESRVVGYESGSLRRQG